MDELYEVISKYFSTVKKTGYVPLKTVEDILVMDFLEELISDPDFLLFATCEQEKLVRVLINCVKQNCLL